MREVFEWTNGGMGPCEGGDLAERLVAREEGDAPVRWVAMESWSWRGKLEAGAGLVRGNESSQRPSSHQRRNERSSTPSLSFSLARPPHHVNENSTPPPERKTYGEDTMIFSRRKNTCFMLLPGLRTVPTTRLVQIHIQTPASQPAIHPPFTPIHTIPNHIAAHHTQPNHTVTAHHSPPQRHRPFKGGQAKQTSRPDE